MTRPAGWARAQCGGDISQYARFVFLREAWRSAIDDGDTSWIDNFIEASEGDPRGPGSGIGPALKRILACGAAREDLAEVVRVMQWTVLHGIMYQLSGGRRG